MRILSQSIIISTLICISTQVFCMNQEWFTKDFNYRDQCCRSIDIHNQSYTELIVGADNLITQNILNNEFQHLQNIIVTTEDNLLNNIKKACRLSDNQWEACLSINQQLFNLEQNRCDKPSRSMVHDDRIPQYFVEQLLENFADNDINPALINLKVNNNNSSSYTTMHPSATWTTKNDNVTIYSSVNFGYIELNSNFVRHLSQEQQKTLAHILTYQIKYPLSILSVIAQYCNITITPEHTKLWHAAHATILEALLAIESHDKAELLKEWCQKYHTQYFSPSDYDMFSKIEVVQRYLAEFSDSDSYDSASDRSYGTDTEIEDED